MNVTQPTPSVHVIVLDHDGGAMTIECVRSLSATDWPRELLRIVLVDNGSTDSVADAVRAELPDVRIVRSDTNRGYAGGMNVGLEECRHADFVALVNNDTIVDPGWLRPLVATLRADARVGAACPKLLLADPCVEVAIGVAPHRRGRGDRRELGVRLSGARADDEDLWARTRLVEGFWGPEPMPVDERGGQWTSGHARLFVPVARPGDATTVVLRLAADRAVRVAIAAGSATTEVDVVESPRWYSARVGTPPVDVVNNVGSVVHRDGYASDRGWLEVDRGQYDEPADVDAFCGAAVLLSRAFLDDVGSFDESLFMYYEDVELSLRGASRGWRYRTAPTSVVRHRHATSSVEGSTFKAVWNERNRLLVATRHGSIARSGRLSLRYLLATASYARRDILAPLLRGEGPRPEIVWSRARAFGSFARAAPSALRARASGASGRSPREDQTQRLA